MKSIISISRKEAIKVMENNLKILKECSDSDTFLLLSYDLENKRSLGRKRLNKKSGRKLLDKSKTFVLNNDNDEDSVSMLSIYTVLQKDIYNIMPIGEKHDMILIHKLE